jgi:hypothetical protein
MRYRMMTIALRRAQRNRAERARMWIAPVSELGTRANV